MKYSSFVTLDSPRSSQYCDEPLLNISVAGIVFTFAMIGKWLYFNHLHVNPLDLQYT